MLFVVKKKKVEGAFIRRAFIMTNTVFSFSKVTVTKQLKHIEQNSARN